MHLLQTLFVCQLLGLAVSWTQYEQPIQISTPNQDGVYEFDLVVEHRLTMGRLLKFGKVGVVDFDSNTGDWYQRDSNQLAACNKTGVLVPHHASAELREDLLKDVIQLDGLHHRMITINGKTPGDTIVVPYGAEVVLRVKNHLNTESITLHVHGLDKRGLWYTDGVAHVQQCPIPVGSEFTYRFIADAYGTHWYHGHLASDRAEGMLGGFVVKDPDHSVPDPADPANRLIIHRDYYALLQDWAIPTPAEQHYNLHDGTMKWVSGLDGERKDQCWAPTRTYDGSNVGGSVPMSSFLVNDKGWHDQFDILNRASKAPVATFLIGKGEDVLVRFVNGGVAQEIMITLEGHNMTIVAADGLEVKPVTVDSLVIFGGERYDVLIRGLRNPVQRQYRFIMETMEGIHWNWGPYEPFYGIANLEYEGAEQLPVPDKVDFKRKQQACTRERKCTVFNCPFGRWGAQFNLTCISAHTLENADGVVDAALVQEAAVDGMDERFINMHFDSHVDGYMFSKPKGMPYFHASNLDAVAAPCDPRKCDRHNSSKYDHEHCDCFVHFKFDFGAVVQLVIYNMGDGGTAGTGYSHPFHLHGTHFHVMKIGYPDYFENGTIKAMNRDLPCDDVTKRCLDLSWRNATWTGGRVGGMQKVPSLRDTILIPTGGYTVIRFRADNPGWWFAHCHLMLHHMGGTAFAFRIGDHEQIPVPPTGFPHDCGIFDVAEPLKLKIKKRASRNLSKQ